MDHQYIVHSILHLVLRNPCARVLLCKRVLPKVIPRPSTTSSKVSSDLLLSLLSSASCHIKVLVHSLLGPIKSLNRPSHRPPVEAERLSELLPEPRTVPILLIRHLTHPVCMTEHVVQQHRMDRCIGTLLTAPLSMYKLKPRCICKEITICILTKPTYKAQVRHILLRTCSKISNIVGDQLTNIDGFTIHNSSDHVDSRQWNLGRARGALQCLHHKWCPSLGDRLEVRLQQHLFPSLPLSSLYTHLQEQFFPSFIIPITISIPSPLHIALFQWNNLQQIIIAAGEKSISFPRTYNPYLFPENWALA